MAGFLDSQEQIIDMVLTGYGKKLLSEGNLNFVYWVAFDDEVDYHYKTDDALIREATTGYKMGGNVVGRDTTNVNRPLFNVAPGKERLPDVQLSASENMEVWMNQQSVVRQFIYRDEQGNVIDQVGPYQLGIARSDTTHVTVDLQYNPKDYGPEESVNGFLVRVFSSGSDGVYHEQWHNFDQQNNVILGPLLKVEVTGAK